MAKEQQQYGWDGTKDLAIRLGRSIAEKGNEKFWSDFQPTKDERKANLLVSTSPDPRTVAMGMLSIYNPPMQSSKGTLIGYVLASYGTLIRVIKEDPTELDFDRVYEVPPHRITNAQDRQDTHKDNKALWESQSKIPDKVGEVVKRGWSVLISDGYVHSGTNLADRVVHGSNIIWPCRDDGDRFVNFASESLISTHYIGDVAADLRRYDYLMPRIVAVILPDGQVTHI